jgi:hypothetical protein
MDNVAVRSNEQLLPMEQFLSNGPGLQPAIFIVGPCGHVSTNKGCTCRNIGPELEMPDTEENMRDSGLECKKEEAAQGF